MTFVDTNVLMYAVGVRLFPWVFGQLGRAGSRELLTLFVTSVAISLAFGAAELFGVSFALGAFFAGMMMRESEFSHRAADESLPLREAFSVLFFVSVGMLFDPQVLLEQPVKLLVVVAIVMVGKTLAAIALVLVFRYPLNTALTVGASLAQIGEFSFILASLGASLGLLPPEGHTLILAGALISIALNSAVFALVEPARNWISERSSFARQLETRDDPLAQLPMSVPQSQLTGQVVLVGYGRVGRRIAEAMQASGVDFVVAEQNREKVERLREKGLHAVCGDAAEPATLIQAHVARAAMLVIATPDAFNVRKVVETARTLNPPIEVIVRTHSEDEARMLRRESIGTVFMGEDELAKGMSRHLIERMGKGTRKEDR